MKSTRNYNIDFFRGIAVIGVLFIHTCFWSGGSFVPSWLKMLSLIIDVPLFIFISGMCINFHNSLLKTIKGLLKFWKEYLVFLILYFVIASILDIKDLTLINIIKGFFFLLPENNSLLVVQGSFWFIPMFFTVSIISSIIIHFYNKNFKDLKNFKYILILSFLLYGIKLYNPNFHFLDVQTFFYVFLFLLGYYCLNIKINFKIFLAIETALTLALIPIFKYSRYSFLDMQIAKFDYHINYMLYSLISIILVLFLIKKINIKKQNIITLIGKNALLFYFCQGISTSLNYYCLNYMNVLSGHTKLLIMFSTNVLAASILVLFMKVLLKLVEIIIPKLDLMFKKIFT